MQEGEQMKMNLTIYLPRGLLSDENIREVSTAVEKVVPHESKGVDFGPNCAFRINCSKMSGENIGKAVDEIRAATAKRILMNLNLAVE